MNLQDFEPSWSEFTYPKKTHWSVLSIKKDHLQIYLLFGVSINYEPEAFLPEFSAECLVEKLKDKETLTIHQK